MMHDISSLLQAHQRTIPLTLHEKGVTSLPTAYSPLMDDADWWAAKTAWNYLEGRPYTDAEKQAGAERIVDALWPEEKTREVQAKVGGTEPVFITVPSTSGMNRLVPALAERLCHHWGLKAKASILKGEAIARSLHSEPMKNVPRDSRPYEPREYLLLSPQSLRQRIEGRSVVIVEDVFSSGASAKGFCDALAEARVQVATVVGLLGDSRLDCEPQLVSKLQRALKNAGIPVKSKDIVAVLSRGQVNILIDNINKARSKDEYASIAGNLQRVLDSRAARYLGQDSWRPGQEYSHVHDVHTQRIRDGVRTYPGGQVGSRQEGGRSATQPATVNDTDTPRVRKGGRRR